MSIQSVRQWLNEFDQRFWTRKSLLALPDLCIGAYQGYDAEDLACS